MFKLKCNVIGQSCKQIHNIGNLKDPNMSNVVVWCGLLKVEEDNTRTGVYGIQTSQEMRLT